MAGKLLVGLAVALVGVGGVGIVLVGANVVRVDGGHGLVRWYALSTAATAAAAGALLAVAAAFRSPVWRRGARLAAMLGAALFAAFVTAWGLPFVP